MVYNGGIAIAAAAHIIFAATYFGLDVVTSRALLPSMRVGKTNAEMAVIQALFKRLTPLFAVATVGTLVTGVIFLFVKYGTDISLWLLFPGFKPVLIALALFFVLGAMAGRIFIPATKWLAAQDFTASPTEPVSKEVEAHFVPVFRVVKIQNVIILLIIILMVVAANGGF